MKKSLILLLMIAGFAACNKDENPTTPTEEQYKCTTCINIPEAKPAYDQNSGGVYKGVLVGSSGTIALYLYNTGTVVEALVSFDGQSGILTCSTLGGWMPGQPIQNALFSGTLNNETINAQFSVDANGQNPQVSVQIPGHDVVVAVYKETSASLIKCFQGTYSGDDAGIFNMVFDGDDFTLVTDDGTDPASGTRVNGNIHVEFDGIIVDGTMQGTDKMSGTWNNTVDNEQGSWEGLRTL